MKKKEKSKEAITNEQLAVFYNGHLLNFLLPGDVESYLIKLWGEKVPSMDITVLLYPAMPDPPFHIEIENFTCFHLTEHLPPEGPQLPPTEKIKIFSKLSKESPFKEMIKLINDQNNLLKSMNLAEIPIQLESTEPEQVSYYSIDETQNPIRPVKFFMKKGIVLEPFLGKEKADFLKRPIIGFRNGKELEIIKEKQ